jgi:hypothetical protein
MKMMKKIGFLAALVILMSSCEEHNLKVAPQSRRLELDTTTQYSDQQYRIYTLEGCEYIVVGYGKERWGTHKGNCSNPLHRPPVPPIDTTEKHFDCYVEECYSEGGEWIVTTECGIQFHSKTPHRKGQVLKNFVSPQHK